MNKINKLTLLILLFGLVLNACKKFEETLERKDKESGIVRIITSSGSLTSAKTEEEITVLAKIGEPVESLKFYVGEVEMTIKTSKSTIDSVEDVFTDTKVGLPVIQYTFTIPKNAKIGPNNVYFIINGKTRPPMPLQIIKPDILFPGKVTVYPYAQGVATHGYKVDGPIGTASMEEMANMTYDPTHQAFYFSDTYADDPTQPGSRRFSVIRKIQDSVVTTIAGGGNNPDAAHGKDYKVSNITAMCPGPDGSLYFATEDLYYPLNPGGTAFATRSQIMKIDPTTGNITHIAGGKIRNGNAWNGFKDGKDSANLTYVSSMTFDKAGNLYFLDFRALVRKVAPDGKVTTLFGKYNSISYEATDPETGAPLLETYYEPVEGHTDGFGDEVLFQNALRIVVAGNGKIYVQEGDYGEWQTNIREINMDTREVSTIIGLPGGVRTYLSTGTFKEVELGEIHSFDIDFDGNIIYSALPPFKNRVHIYKMDIQSETIALLAGNDMTCTADPTQPIPGAEACWFIVTRIVFDQFGTLYVANPNTIRKIIIEK